MGAFFILQFSDLHCTLVKILSNENKNQQQFL